MYGFSQNVFCKAVNLQVMNGFINQFYFPVNKLIKGIVKNEHAERR